MKTTKRTPQTEDRIPHDLEIEKATLSSMFVSPTAAKCVTGAGITAEDFFDCRNVSLFGTFQALLKEGKPLDYFLVLNRCASEEEAAWANEIFSVCTTGANWKYYAEVLREHATARKIVSSSREMLDAAAAPDRFAELPALLSEQLTKIQAGLATPASEETFDQQLDAFIESLERQEPRETFRFGIPALDSHLNGGAHRGEMIVVGGGTGAGKSVLLGMAALDAALADKAVAIFSLEMNSDDLISRMGSNLAGCRIKGIAESPTKREMDATSHALMALRGKCITLDTKIRDIADIEQHSMKLAGEGKADLVIMDYLQLLQTDEGETREQVVASISRRLKNLAMRANFAVVTASQLNDEGLLRESRAIGQNADAVLIIDGDNILIDKNRRGPRDVAVPVNLRGDISRFE